MRCLICNENFNVEVLKYHYQYNHSVNGNNYFFKEPFLPDDNSKNCDECHIRFKNCQQRKTYNFLFHRSQQMGGIINQAHIMNIHGRGPIVCYLISFRQHKNFYDFYDESIVDSFFYSVQRSFTQSALEMKFQGYFEPKNYQQTKIAEIENTRVWLTNVYVAK